MQISSRFTLAIHMCIATELFKDDYKVTGDFLAGSTGSNPVVVRNIIAQLKKAGIFDVTRGSGGAELAKPMDEISFYDIYRAVECVDDDMLFHFHEHANPDCPVGGNIHELLEGALEESQHALEKELQRYSIRDMYDGLQEILKRKEKHTGDGDTGNL